MQISKLINPSNSFQATQRLFQRSLSSLTMSPSQRSFKTNFKLLEDMSKEEQEHTPMFTVSKEFGFLPRKAPMRDLPPKYEIINKLLKDATINQPDGSKGHLHFGTMGDAIMKELPLIDVSKENDMHLVGALFRDYCYLSSEYLLEPCDV